ncbi:class I SAM-dependent methyltransferase [Candidatus Pelagibacter bacterium]|nr:class I SAM-dependent methyltransferase [Candidatus Pelagibacter bacterium]MDB2710201.1 class I SAM-dependent methyltransferase [Candidatus Pelagibacter bacterium]
MKKEIDLLSKYPKPKRDIEKRGQKKTSKDRNIARKFGKDFFDGKRSQGYGGFSYHPRFWRNVVLDFKKHWNLKENNSVLDVGCAKGFMLYDFKNLIPKLNIEGIDISKYAIDNSKQEIKYSLKVADAKELPYDDNSFDYVISINTIHNLDLTDCKKALKEIQRVSKKDSFITVDAYSNIDEKNKMFEWNLTAKTILSIDEWKNVFNETGYTGDYFWFIP